MVHDRRVGGRELTLGVSGKLIDGNLVMYDTATDSLWHQASGEARQGGLSGEQLSELPAESWGVERWGDWLKSHPETLVLTCAHCEGRGEASGTIDRVDEPAPDFELVGLDGRRHRLSDYRGRVVLINFWATWCIACRTEIPDLNRLYAEIDPEEIALLGISVDEEGQEKVVPYAEEMAMVYPILLDPQADSVSIFGGVSGYPSTFILDRQGLIYSSYLGAQSAETLRADLTYLLDAPASRGASLPDGAVAETPEDSD